MEPLRKFIFEGSDALLDLLNWSQCFYYANTELNLDPGSAEPHHILLWEH